MNTEFLIDHWNDILTVLTFVSTIAIAFYQIRYYRNQQPAFELGNVTNAEYHDFDDYTKYEFTIAVKNNGRDPVSIPKAELSVKGEEIQLNNVENTERFSPEVSGTFVSTHEFRTIELGANAFEHVELSGSGAAVETTEPITGELQLDTSVGEVSKEITFDRAP